MNRKNQRHQLNPYDLIIKVKKNISADVKRKQWFENLRIMKFQTTSNIETNFGFFEYLVGSQSLMKNGNNFWAKQGHFIRLWLPSLLKCGHDHKRVNPESHISMDFPLFLLFWLRMGNQSFNQAFGKLDSKNIRFAHIFATRRQKLVILSNDRSRSFLFENFFKVKRIMFNVPEYNPGPPSPA